MPAIEAFDERRRDHRDADRTLTRPVENDYSVADIVLYSHRYIARFAVMNDSSAAYK